MWCGTASCWPTRVLIRSQVAFSNSPWWTMSSSSSAWPALRYRPSCLTNFSAFQLEGLWPAVMEMPPCAPVSRTASCRLGVGQTPRSTTSQPVASRPDTTAAWTMGPDGRGSRPTRIRPRSRYVPNACAKLTMSSGVSVSPTMPRTPVMPILSGRMGGSYWRGEGIGERGQGRDQARGERREARG